MNFQSLVISAIVFSNFLISFTVAAAPVAKLSKTQAKVWMGNSIPQCPEEIRLFKLDPSLTKEINYSATKNSKEYLTLEINKWFKQEKGLCFYGALFTNHRREPSYYGEGMPPAGFGFLAITKGHKTFEDSVGIVTPNPDPETANLYDWYDYGVCATYNSDIKRYQLTLPKSKIKRLMLAEEGPSPCKSASDF